MNTRFKVLSLIVIFALSFIVLYIFFSSNGIVMNTALKKEKTLVEEKVREKEGTVKSLWARTESVKEEDTRVKELIYAFPDESIFDPVTNRGVEAESGGYTYFKTYQILIISTLITLLYSLLIFLFIPCVKRRKRNGKNY